jgi:glycosyltransferase involved in cell wall biosynthesis
MKANSPIVSIVCFAYNHENFIRIALQGFVMQRTNFPIEIIVHDDTSTDDTKKIIKEFENNYPEIIKPIYQTENQASKERGRVTRICFEAAQGKYIALCEGDDYWIDPLKLQKQVDFLEGNADFSICGSLAKRIHEDLQSQDDVEGEAGVFDQKDLAQRNFIPTASALIKREHIVNLPSWFTDCPIGDWPLFLLCANHGKIKMFNEHMVVRRLHTGGIWGANINNTNSITNVLALFKLFGVIKNKFNQEVNNLLNINYIKQVKKLIEFNLKNDDFKHISSYLQLCFKKEKDLTQEMKQVAEGIVKKIALQQKEVIQLKKLNQQLMDSTSYKLGRGITGCFMFFKK